MRIDISQSLKAAKTEADFHTSGVAGILLQADIFPQFNISKQNPNAPRQGTKKSRGYPQLYGKRIKKLSRKTICETCGAIRQE